MWCNLLQCKNLRRHKMIKTLIKCADIMSLPLGFAAVMCGASGAALKGNFDGLQLILCLFFALFFQTLGNFMQRYADVSGNPRESIEQYLLLSDATSSMSLKSMLKEGISTMGIMMSMIGMAMLAINGAWLLGLLALLLLIVYFNSFGPRPLARTRFNWLVTFLLFGPIAVFSTSYLMAMHRAVDALTIQDFMPTILLSVLMGFMAGNSLLLYNYFCFDSDRLHGKNTFATVLGKKGTQIFFIAAGAIPFLMSLSGVQKISLPSVFVPNIMTFIAMVAYTVIGLQLPRVDKNNYRRYQTYLNLIPALLSLVYLIVFLAYGAPDMRHIEIF